MFQSSRDLRVASGGYDGAAVTGTARVAVRVALADLVAAAAAGVLAFAAGPRSPTGFSDWLIVAALALFAVATGAIYGGELRRVNPLRSRRPIDRSGLPPRDQPPIPEVRIEERPPRLRAMGPAAIAFLVAIAVALAVRFA